VHRSRRVDIRRRACRRATHANVSDVQTTDGGFGGASGEPLFTMAVMSHASSREGDGATPREATAVAIDIDDIEDVEFELRDVAQPPSPAEPPTLAAGSELRRRIVTEQNLPNRLDLQLIAYLLDIDPP
jgi:hypothetical protein